VDSNRGRGARAPADSRRPIASGSGQPDRGSLRHAGRADLTVVAVASTEVRLHTRLRVKVGSAISCAVHATGSARMLTGTIERCSVWRIDPDGLVFEVSVALDHPLSTSDAEALAEAADEALRRAHPVMTALRS
jgi:hypothetical protein